MHSAYTQTHMSYLIMELSPHIPLLAVTTLALVFVVNPVWFSVLLLLITFLISSVFVLLHPLSLA